MKIILSFSIGLNLLLLLLTLRILKDKFVNIFLFALLLLVLIGTSYVISLEYIQLPFYFLDHFINSLPSLVGSLTYLYVYYSINSNKTFKVISLLHLFPIFIAFPLSFYIKDDLSILSFFLNIIIKIVASLVYFIYSIQLIKKHKRFLQNHVSNIEEVDFKWLKFIVNIGLLSYIIYLVIMSLWYLDIQLIPNLYNYANIVTLLFIFSISYYSLSATKIFERISKLNTIILENDESIFTEENSGILNIVFEKKKLVGAEEATVIFENILVLMEAKKMFKNENLMLEDLAKELNLHSKYLSCVINNISGKNFFDFINHFRVKEFNKEVLDPKNNNLTLISIAYSCGFGSKSAFNRSYKSEMGISPSDFVKANT